MLNDTSICLVNAQLEPNLKTRMQSFNDIHLQMFQTEGVGKKKEEKIEQLDYKFFFGDTGLTTIYEEVELRAQLETY